MLLATFAVGAGGTPHLVDTTTVAPGGDHAYETQVWAPDGTGVLYTAFSSDGNRSIGWLNSELYFLRLYGRGASPARPRVTHLTDGNPGWDEQAVFTPDMKDVIWMSSRATPTWYQTVVTAAQAAGYDPPDENDVVGPFFVLTVLDPKFRTDLYQLDLRTHAVRRLTDLGQVIPEFYFDPGGTRLLWTTGDHSRTYLGSFSSPRNPCPPASPSRPGLDRRSRPRGPHASPSRGAHHRQARPAERPASGTPGLRPAGDATGHAHPTARRSAPRRDVLPGHRLSPTHEERSRAQIRPSPVWPGARISRASWPTRRKPSLGGTAALARLARSILISTRSTRSRWVKAAPATPATAVA